MPPAPSAGQLLANLLLTLVVYAFLFSGTAVLVRRQFGAVALWGGTLVLAIALASLLTLWASRIGVGGDSLEAMLFIMALVMIVVPTSSAALVTDRLSRRVPLPGLGRHVGLTVLAFLLAAPLGMVMGAAIDFARMW